MRKLALTGIMALALLLLAVSAASAEGFGLRPGPEGFSVTLTDAEGNPAAKAGTHPEDLEIDLGFNLAEAEGQPGLQVSDGDLKDLKLTMPPGFLVNPIALDVPNRKDTFCTQADFHTPRQSPFQASMSGEDCPDASQVGTVTVNSSTAGTRTFGLFNLAPRYGAPFSLGFSPFGTPIELSPRIREGDAALVFEVRSYPQKVDVSGFELNIWGTPWEQTFEPGEAFPHDNERGDCLNEEDPSKPFGVASEIKEVDNPTPPPEKLFEYVQGTCGIGDPATYPPKSILTLPVACEGPISWGVEATSWQQSAVANRQVQTAAITSCNKTLATGRVALSTDSAASATGLDFALEVNDGGGLANPGGILRPPIKRAVVSLPEGLAINPSLAAGLGVCSEAQLAAETLTTPPGGGCPNQAKIGDIEVSGLLGLRSDVEGSLYLAAPFQNPFGTLISLFMVVRSQERGLFVKSVGKVEPDPRTGQLRATFDHLPQLPYTAFRLHFREGQRAAMISPPSCGSFSSSIELTPWPKESPLVANSSSFALSRGEAGGPCPNGSARPFAPSLVAGSLNPIGGAYAAFDLRIARSDSEQEITSYSAEFPPGLLAKLVGTTRCSDQAIAAAKGTSATEQQAFPSCPASSRIGSTLAGYGIGRVLAYAPGALYLAGPHNNSQLSVVAITSAKVGPFDLGTVVIRSAIRIDPRTAKASIDPRGSDPIPHVLQGIPLHLRDIRVHVDRHQFTVNPTSCDPLTVASRVGGSGNDPFSQADETSFTATDRFQALGCSSLGFEPKLTFRLKGGTKRGRYPSLTATFTPPPGNAGLATAAVTLPPSIFLAQEHLGTICTKAQFSQGSCPARSIYGSVKATTPLLAEPLEGPVYLRSSETMLPDLVASLKGGGVSIEVPGTIDSFRGGLRASFELLPDAPVSSFQMRLPGGRRGVLINSENLCAKAQLASVRMSAHNNKTAVFQSKLKTNCKKKKVKKHKRKGKGRRGGKKR